MLLCCEAGDTGCRNLGVIWYCNCCGTIQAFSVKWPLEGSRQRLSG
ncbi:MAG: hypothetical protein K5637_03890 [Lachnospiraceae bacterium]|nr:hypothetical protein [Lachnospiraceae bacterium]